MYRESDVGHTPKQMTWEDMQNDEALQDAVVRLGAGFDSTGEWGHETTATVVDVEYFLEDEVPLPVERTKYIIRKCEENSD